MMHSGAWLRLGLLLMVVAGCTRAADYGYRSTPPGFRATGPLDTIQLDSLQSNTAVGKSPGGVATWPLRPRH